MEEILPLLVFFTNKQKIYIPKMRIIEEYPYFFTATILEWKHFWERNPLSIELRSKANICVLPEEYKYSSAEY
ncbi:MAG: hypothetical protein OHK0045_03810 [Raineya sp.]